MRAANQAEASSGIVITTLQSEDPPCPELRLRPLVASQ